MHYVVIHGLAPAKLMGQGDESDRVAREYVAGIVYGVPKAIYAVVLSNGRFVAFVSYEDQDGPSLSTYLRMPSFNYGAQRTSDLDKAWAEFGSWIGHYSGCLNPEPVTS